MTIRVLLVDDQPLVRAGLRRILEADPSMVVVGEARDGGEAIAATASLQPNVVLMDVRMPILDGIEATRRICGDGGAGAGVQVIVLTTFGLDEIVVEALRAGASAFVLKEAPPERILATIHEVARGHAVIDPAVTQAVIDRLGLRPARPDLTARIDELTPREREVLTLVARGRSNAEIAIELVITEGTTKTHVAHVLSKLRVRDRAQAIVLAYDAGIV